MAKPIFLKVLRQILDPKGSTGSPVEFDIAVYKVDGSIVRDRVVCTSSYFKNDTINVKHLESGEIRTYKAYLIFEFNGKKVIP